MGLVLVLATALVAPGALRISDHLGGGDPTVMAVEASQERPEAGTDGDDGGAPDGSGGSAGGAGSADGEVATDGEGFVDEDSADGEDADSDSDSDSGSDAADADDAPSDAGAPPADGEAADGDGTDGDGADGDGADGEDAGGDGADQGADGDADGGAEVKAAGKAAGARTAASEADGVLGLVNAERAAAGCGALRADSALDALALAHSRDMAARGFFDHVTPDGRSPWDRADAAGVAGLGAENIARGQADARAVVAAWMASPGHRANILNCDLTRHGLGMEPGAGGPWWTQVFGR